MSVFRCSVSKEHKTATGLHARPLLGSVVYEVCVNHMRGLET